MTSTVYSPLVPEALPVPDPIIEALARLENDPGALFEHDVLILLRQVRRDEPARWARIRQQAKDAKTVNLASLDKLTCEPSPSDNTVVGEIFPEVRLWPELVDGSTLLDELADTIKCYVIADQSTIHAAALWAAMTWFIDVVNVAPIANVSAPEKRCGKTVLLGVLSRLSCRPLAVSNIGPAALFRAIELWQPTLLIDEVDAFLAQHDEARGILNAGFTRDTAFVIRCTGDDHTPTPFNVWGAKALCGIGKIADTLADRSIPMRLRRKMTGERTVKIRHADPQVFAELASKLARFALDNRNAVRFARPAEIEGLNDRANDCWEPLLAIAEVAGGDWPRIARTTAISLHGLEEDAPSINAELLTSIRDAFDSRRTDRLSTADLLDALAQNDEAPWATWNRGKPMTPHQLAKRLSEFSITSNSVRIGIKTPKGYRSEQFTDAFERYLSDDTPSATATPPQPSQNGACSQSVSATPRPKVAPAISLKASNHEACGAVAVPKHLVQEEQDADGFEDF